MSESTSGFSRRKFLLGASILGGAAVFPGVRFLGDQASGAILLQEPKRIKSVHGILKTTLEVKPALIPFDGGVRWALTYNGQYPAPTFVVKPGDTLSISLKNSYSESTNLHTHGLHVSPSGNGDNPLIMVEPGATQNYLIKIPKNNPGGTGWYHPHHHGNSATQTSAGLTGAIIVQDETDAQNSFAKLTDRVLMLADPRIGKDSSVLSTSMMDSMHGRTGPNLLINGVKSPSISGMSDKGERWRIVNSCVSRYVDFKVEGADIFVIATDVARVSAPLAVSSVVMTPGTRYELLVKPRKSGTLKIYDGTEVIGTYVAKTSTQIDLKAIALPAVTSLKATSTRTLNIRGAGGNMGSMGGMNHAASFTFDGKEFDPNVVNQKVKLGTVEDWIIHNPSGMHHPFHIHAWPFQIIDRGDGRGEPGWRDMVNVPSGGKVRIRINFADFGGTTVYHCHILDHEDGGMMGIVQVS